MEMEIHLFEDVFPSERGGIPLLGNFRLSPISKHLTSRSGSREIWRMDPTTAFQTWQAFRCRLFIQFLRV